MRAVGRKERRRGIVEQEKGFWVGGWMEEN